MKVVERMVAERSEKPAEQQIILAVERRKFLKRRWRGIAEDGTELGFDLESRLKDGCVVFQENNKDYIVKQLPEVVYEVPFLDQTHASLVGWKVGNLHLPAQVMENSLRILHDEAMVHLLAREGWSYTEPEVLFSPMKAVQHT